MSAMRGLPKNYPDCSALNHKETPIQYAYLGNKKRKSPSQCGDFYEKPPYHDRFGTDVLGEIVELLG
jgi:hypothetical protein